MLLISVLTLLFLYGTAEAGFTEQPADTSAIQGETATLKCTVVMNTNNVVLSWLYWSKGNKHLSINDTILPDMGADVKARYSITGNRSSGEYYLSISNVNKVDQGSYHCSYISNTGGETSIPARLTILVPPEDGYPKCEAHPSSDGGFDSSTIWPGQGVVFSCNSRGGDPAAQLSWHRGNDSILEPRTSRITYERILTREDNGITFTCKAESPALLTPRKCSVTPMKITPVVQVRSMSGQIKSGENGTFHCEGSAIPRVYKYTWYAFSDVTPIESDHRFTISNHNQVLTIHDVDYSENRMEIRCEVAIKAGLKSSASIRLDVAEPPKPKIITKPPAIEKKDEENGGHRIIPDIRKIISMDINFVVAIIAGSLVLLLLIVAIIMGCWVCGTTKPRRPSTLPRVQYTETVPTTIPQSYSMDGLNYQGHMFYGDTSCAVSNPALDNENAPGYISALYATLDKNKRPVRTSVAINIPGKPIAQVTPSQSVDGGAGTSGEHSGFVKPVKVAPEPVKISPLVGKVAAVEHVKPLVKPTVVKPEIIAPVKPEISSPVKPQVKPPMKPEVSSSSSTSSETASSADTNSTNDVRDNSSDDGTDVDTTKNTKKP
ncbi:nephrin-like [Amphiura filiformis]|uniref:nephrin-like n=1 Tax=Amphiura filiformis TaxID=82378 RepID=UPI003B21C743